MAFGISDIASELIPWDSAWLRVVILVVVLHGP
jgi:hypothetical protein